MAMSAVEPFLAASARGCKKSLTMLNSKRLQACFGWAKTGSTAGYGAWLKFTRLNGKTITVSMLLGILPVTYASTSPGLFLQDVSAKTKLTIPNRDSLSSSPKAMSNFYVLLRQPWIFVFLFFRCIKLSLFFLPLLILYPILQKFPHTKLFWLHLLRKAFEYSGATFMKFGQWMSTRRDIFSPELCAVFATLYRHTPPHAFRHTEKALDRAFGKTWRKTIRFANSSRSPVGSGCVAQVYRVNVLASSVSRQDPEQSIDSDSLGPFDITPVRSPSSGSVVAASKGPQYVEAALKVLHPNVEEQVVRDLIIMEFGANILEFLFRDFRWLRLRDCVLAFSSLMRKQLDLRIEAQNLEAFKKNFINFRTVSFPSPHYPYVAKNVLMESWEDGIPINNYISDAVPHKIKEELASLGVDVLLKMTFIDNFVHADMHPGNLMVKQKVDPVKERAKMIFEDIGDMIIVGMSKRPSPLQLVILDAGLTASLSQYDFDSFKGVFAAVVKGDGDLVADKFLLHAAADACKDRAGFRRDMSKLVHEARSRELSLDQIDVGQLLSDLFSVLVKHHVKLESNFVSIMLSIMVLEGLGRSLDPNLDLLEKAKPVLLRKLIF